MKNQLSSVLSSMRDLASWVRIMRKVRDQPRTTREELVNDLKAVGKQKQLVTHYTIMDPAVPARSPCSRRHMYRFV